MMINDIFEFQILIGCINNEINFSRSVFKFETERLRTRKRLLRGIQTRHMQKKLSHTVTTSSHHRRHHVIEKEEPMTWVFARDRRP